MTDRGRTLSIKEVVTHLKHVQGQILTLVEASYSDPVQREAQKRTVSKVFGAKLNEIIEGTQQRRSDEQSKRKGPHSQGNS